jgi:hypothetical protein
MSRQSEINPLEVVLFGGELEKAFCAHAEFTISQRRPCLRLDPHRRITALTIGHELELMRSPSRSRRAAGFASFSEIQDRLQAPERRHDP